jgi:hypothetical protein
VNAVIDGLACSVFIDKTACPAYPVAKVVIKGLGMNTMTQLTRLGYEAFTRSQNLIQIDAGDESGMSLAYQGDIVTAWANFNTAPDIQFEIKALGGYFASMQPDNPLSINGSQSIEAVVSQVAAKAGFVVQNEGVTGDIKNTELHGDVMTKVQTIARTKGFNVIVDGKKIILLPNQKVRGTPVPNISAANGLIGYPTFDDKGVNFECMYRPDIEIGGLAKLETIVPRASGEWVVIGVKHTLSANDPHNQVWKTSVQGIFPNYGR